MHTSQLVRLTLSAAAAAILSACVSVVSVAPSNTPVASVAPANKPGVKAKTTDAAKVAVILPKGSDPKAGPTPFASTYKPLPSQLTALVGGHILTATGEEIESGTVVMDDDFIDSYIELKMEEVMRLQMHPHPVEFDMYYKC